MNTYPPARRLLVWLPALIWATVIFLLSAQPSDRLPDLGFDGQSILGHLLTYALLMGLLVFALHRSTRLPDTRVWVLAFLLVALYGASDEFHQSFVPGRHTTLFDWLTDLTGAGLVWVVHMRRRRA